MALFGNLERRHIGRGENRTCIAIEPQFWQVADKVAQCAGMNWRRRAKGRGHPSLGLFYLETACEPTHRKNSLV